MPERSKTMTQPVEIVHQDGDVIDVPLNKLKKSPRNARRTPHAEADIEALAASIAVKGAPASPAIAEGPRSAWDAPVVRAIRVAASAAEEDDDGGLRRELEVGAPDATEPEAFEPLPDAPPAQEDADAELPAATRLQTRFRQAARQASLDPDDGIPL